MTNPNGDSTSAVRALENRPKECRLVVLNVTTERVAAEIGELNHPRELTIDKKGCFDDSKDVGPKSPVLVKVAHHFGVFRSDGLIIVVDQDSENPVLDVWAQIRKVQLEARDYLLKSLLTDIALHYCRIEVFLVDALRKKSCKGPTRHALSDLVDKAFALSKCKMYVRSCVRIVLLLLAIRFILLGALKFQ